MKNRERTKTVRSLSLSNIGHQPVDESPTAPEGVARSQKGKLESESAGRVHFFGGASVV